MSCQPRLRHSMFLGIILVSAASSAVCGEDLLEELKKVPYRIAFESCQGRNWDLFTVRADGSDRVNLTRSPDVGEMYPHVSPDGTKLCFVVDEGEGGKNRRDIYCMNMDGSGRRLVGRGARDPCWTADGTAIAYLKDESEELTVLDFATKGLFQYDLATGRHQAHGNPELYHVFGICPTPDGKWYVSSVHGGMGYAHAILAIEARGKGVFNLQIPGCRPDVSPDGKRIAWASSDYSLGVGELDFSGREPRVLNARDVVTSSKPLKTQHVDWSPDGRYLAFSRGPYRPRGLTGSVALVGLQAPGWNICVADAAAANRWVAITTDGNSNKEPDWVPAAR